MPIISNFPFAGGGAGPVTPDYSSWFGTGEDGDLTVSSDVALPVALDSGQIIKQYNNLTVTSTGVLHPANRCNGMILLVKGDLTVDGTIHVDKCAPLLNDIEEIAAQEQHVALCGVKAGGKGGDGGDGAGTVARAHGVGGNGFQFGGGFGAGSGSAANTTMGTSESFAGANGDRPPAGTSIPWVPPYNEASKYGAGGSINYGFSTLHGGGGPGGTGASYSRINSASYTNVGDDGDAIGGGALWIFVAGVVNITESGIVRAKGGNGANGRSATASTGNTVFIGGGGAGGGGIVCIVHNGDLINFGTVHAPGGSGGSAGGGSSTSGSNGESGTVLIAKISDLVGDESGGGISYDSRPKIDFDGKWLKWFVEFYDGEPYWEAWFFSSGTLTVDGSYTADAWGIGGGGSLVGDGTDSHTGRGNAATSLGIELLENVLITIGKGAYSSTSEGGATSLGDMLTASGGKHGENASGLPYRFGDPDKIDETGEDGALLTRAGGGFLALGQGGWLHWKSGTDTYPTIDGEGYGASAGSTGVGGLSISHDGALVIRIKI